MHKVLSEPSEHLWKIQALILNTSLPLPPSCLGFSFALGHQVSFFDGIHNSLANGCLAASRNFGVLTREDEHTSFYSIFSSSHFRDESESHLVVSNSETLWTIQSMEFSNLN